MVTENDRRWPVGLHGTPGRFGKLIEYHLFDAPFFSVHGKQASVSCSTTPHKHQWYVFGTGLLSAGDALQGDSFAAAGFGGALCAMQCGT